MTLTLDAAVTECGDRVGGAATGPDGGATVSLRWSTSGRGRVDSGVASTVSLAEGSGRFELAVPAAGPMTFEGKLITVSWEVVLEADGVAERAELTVLPRGGLAVWVRRTGAPPQA